MFGLEYTKSFPGEDHCLQCCRKLCKGVEHKVIVPSDGNGIKEKAVEKLDYDP